MDTSRDAGQDQLEDLTVLLVEDDDGIREATAMALELYGFTVATAADGLQGRAALRRVEPDIVLLDVMMPFVDGFTLCREIRSRSTVPIIMLTARSDSVDVVQGLEAGADDYVTKPFDPMVLVARMRAVLRRGPVDPTAGSQHHRSAVGDLVVDHEALEVSIGGQRVDLTPTEMRLMIELVENVGIVLSRDTLLTRVWDYPGGGDTRVVDVHMQRLRLKVGKERIETVRGFGYKLRR